MLGKKDKGKIFSNIPRIENDSGWYSVRKLGGDVYKGYKIFYNWGCCVMYKECLVFGN